MFGNTNESIEDILTMYVFPSRFSKVKSEEEQKKQATLGLKC